MMCALSARYTQNQEEACARKVDFLVKEGSPREVPEGAVEHAARGGWFNFILALIKRAELSTSQDIIPRLERILHTRRENGSGDPPDTVRVVRDALRESLTETGSVERLVVQAALGGNSDILDCVLKVGNSRVVGRDSGKGTRARLVHGGARGTEAVITPLDLSCQSSGTLRARMGPLDTRHHVACPTRRGRHTRNRSLRHAPGRRRRLLRWNPVGGTARSLA